MIMYSRIGTSRYVMPASQVLIDDMLHAVEKSIMSIMLMNTYIALIYITHKEPMKAEPRKIDPRINGL